MNVNKRYDELMARLGWADESTKEAVFLLELVAAAEENRENIRVRVNSVAGNVESIRAAVSRENPLMNTLGEFQHRPAQVEAAVGAFMASCRLLEKYLALYGVTE